MAALHRHTSVSKFLRDHTNIQAFRGHISKINERRR